MQGGGQRHHKIRFDRRAPQDDGYGNSLDEWQMIGSVWCGVDTQRRGRKEALEAGRLESTIIWKVTVLRSAMTRALTTEDRGVFTVGPHAGRVANIIAIEATAAAREMILDCEVGSVAGSAVILGALPPPPPTPPLTFTYAPSLTWTVAHNLGRFPSIEVLSAGGVEIFAEVAHLSSNTARISFDVPTAGTVIVS